MKPDNLKLFGPFKFSGGPTSIFQSKLSRQKGIYLWAVKFKEGFLVYYVGETGKSFNERFKEHLDCLKSGQYRIYDPMLFAKGKKKLLWNPYKKGALKRVSYKKEFKAIYSSISRQLKEYINFFDLFLIPYKGQDRIRIRIEATISKKLGSAEGLIGTFQDEDIKYKPRVEGEETVQIRLSFSQNIFGLSREMIV